MKYKNLLLECMEEDAQYLLNVLLLTFSTPDQQSWSITGHNLFIPQRPVDDITSDYIDQHTMLQNQYCSTLKHPTLHNYTNIDISHNY